jgi:hypothetical protein
MTWVIIGFWLLCALITTDMYRNKGHSTAFGVLVGLMLGPVGIIVAATKPNLTK